MYDFRFKLKGIATMQGFSVALLLLGSSVCQAELYNCEGTWTNQPCDGEVRAQLTEHVVTQQELDRRTKYIAARDLISEVTRSAYDYHDLAYKVARVCRKDKTPVEECLEGVRKAREYYRPRIAKANAQAQKEQQELVSALVGYWKEKERRDEDERRHQEKLRAVESLRGDLRRIEQTVRAQHDDNW